MSTRWRRLRGRSASQLLDRARQGASRWLERRGLGDIGEPTGARLSRLLGDAAEDPGAVTPANFFASFDDRDSTLRGLSSVDASFPTTLRARADRILERRFDLLGHKDLSFGNPVDWWLDPIAGVRAPARHWSTIRFLDPNEVGDHKLVWELSRHQALLTLAQAWWCTHESRYGEECARAIDAWLDANPPKLGVHWASSLELAFRAITWVWILAFAHDVLPVALRRRMVGHLAVAARHVERHLSIWFSPNTHLTGEALSLLVLGTALPRLPSAGRWRAKGASILLQWVDRHIRKDGSYVEQSTWYQRYTADFYLHFFALADRTGLDVRDLVARPLAALLEQLAWLTRPDGTMPLIGDDDGGRLVFLDHRTAHDTRTPLAVGAVLLDRPDFAFVAGPPTEELVWMLGPQGLERYRALTLEPPVSTSRAFPDGGLHVIRSGWESTAGLMAIDAGPHGFLNAGHAHADALSIDFTVKGRPILIDPGTFTYTADPALRERFRATSSHNAVVVDGCGSATVGGPFQWLSRVEARRTAWFGCESVVLFAGEHDGFTRLLPPVRYSRIVAFVAPDLWIVRDEIAGDPGDGFEHELAAHWQCAPGLHAELVGHDVLLKRDGAVELSLRVPERPGIWRIEQGQVSPTYGVRQPAPHLRHVRRGLLPCCLTTILHAGGAPVTAQVVMASAPLGAVTVQWGDRRGLFSTRASVGPGWLETDAAAVWVELDSGDAPVSVTAAGVSTLSVGGRMILQQTGDIDGLSLSLREPTS